MVIIIHIERCASNNEEEWKMKIFDTVDLHERTGWAMAYCHEIIQDLEDNNLCIIDNTEEFLSICNNMEDDLK